MHTYQHTGSLIISTACLPSSLLAGWQADLLLVEVGDPLELVDAVAGHDARHGVADDRPVVSENECGCVGERHVYYLSGVGL